MDAASALVPVAGTIEQAHFTFGQTECRKTAPKQFTETRKCFLSKTTDDATHTCVQCLLLRIVKYTAVLDHSKLFICDNDCLHSFMEENATQVGAVKAGNLRVKSFATEKSDTVVRKCARCNKNIQSGESNLSWETMDFCGKLCLLEYQKKIGWNSPNCSTEVKETCLGKYSDDGCLHSFMEENATQVGAIKAGDLRVKCFATEKSDTVVRKCARCNKKIQSGESNLSWETMDFCGKLCLLENQKKIGSNCSNCSTEVKEICLGKYSVRFGSDVRQFCSSSCLEEYKKGLKICCYCQKDISSSGFLAPIGHKAQFKCFCAPECLEKYNVILNQVECVAKPGVTCCICLGETPITIVYEHKLKMKLFCSTPCFQAFSSVDNIVPGKCDMCHQYFDAETLERNAMFHEDVRHSFCSRICQNIYVIASRRIVHCSWCSVKKYNFDMIRCFNATDKTIMACSLHCLSLYQSIKTPVALDAPKVLTNKTNTDPVPQLLFVPVISNVRSLAPTTNGTMQANNVAMSPIKTQIIHQIVVKTREMASQSNMATMCKPKQCRKSTNTRVRTANKQTQTDEITPALIPIPVPTYVPAPVHMYCTPIPVPFPIPIPIPVPIFIPTRRNSAIGIMKEMERIRARFPADPLEAEMLTIAEMAAGGRKEENTDSESDRSDEGRSAEPVSASNYVFDDYTLRGPAIDLEGALTANTVPFHQRNENDSTADSVDDLQSTSTMTETQSVSRKRGMKHTRQASKRGRRMLGAPNMPVMAPAQAPTAMEPNKETDANTCLKYMLGVRAFEQWIATKNSELDNFSGRVKLLKPEILQLTTDELNFSLCLFVKEVRKPNGAEYAPDTIYYLCLGIQQYLFQNGHIDNIFFDHCYQKFTDCFDDIAKKFSILYDDSKYIVTRVEEEHLWESRQLGPHSPQVLLSTLMYFNTKYFHLTTADEHTYMSFTRIIKHWRRNLNLPGNAKSLGLRTTLLRFYPPQSAKKKEVCEQYENLENPLRCPVKLYEFYLTKCPDTVKTRADVLYLQPERACIPDSPLWYSTMNMSRDAVEKMLHRIKVVKEINIAILTN